MSFTIDWALYYTTEKCTEKIIYCQKYSKFADEILIKQKRKKNEKEKKMMEKTHNENCNE